VVPKLLHDIVGGGTGVGPVGVTTGAMGAGIGAVGATTGAMGVRTGSVGRATGSVGVRTGSVGGATGSVGVRTGLVGGATGAVVAVGGGERIGAKVLQLQNVTLHHTFFLDHYHFIASSIDNIVPYVHDGFGPYHQFFSICH